MLILKHMYTILGIDQSFFLLKEALNKGDCLHTHKLRGLGLSNISKLYLGTQLAQLPKYHASKEIALRVALESVDCDPLLVANILWFDPPPRRSLTNQPDYTTLPYYL